MYLINYNHPHSITVPSYTANITSTLSILLSRSSVILLLTDIFALKHMQWWIHQLRYPLAVQFCLSLLTLIFGCGPTCPWSGTNDNICMNRAAANTVTSILGLVVDTLLVIVPINTLKRTPISENSRYTIRGIFYARTGMFACVIAQLYYLWTAAHETQNIVDPFADPWVVVSSQPVACYRILAVCVPYMKHMFDAVGLGTVFASAQPDQGDGSEATRPRPVYRYAAYSECLGAEPAYDQLGNLREVNVDGDAIPLDVAVDFEVARGEVVMLREVRRRSRVSGNNGQSGVRGTVEARGRSESARPGTGDSSDAQNEHSHPRGECGRTAAQHARLAAQQSRQCMINALDTLGSGPGFDGSGGDNIPVTPTRIRQRSTSGLAFQDTASMTTTITAERGFFDFTHDPVESGWEADDGVDASRLELIGSADVHGMCSVPDCEAGSQWPSMTRLPRGGRLKVWKAVEVEVRYEDAGGTSSVGGRGSLVAGERAKDKTIVDVKRMK